MMEIVLAVGFSIMALIMFGWITWAIIDLIKSRREKTMTLAQAYTIQELMNLRDELMGELKIIEDCQSVSGTINDGVNGIGFVWQQGSRQIQYLIDGINKQRLDIEDKILDMKGE